MSEYNKLKQKGLPRGRTPLTPEEKQLRVMRNKMRQEARRRAGIVLQHRYAEEFEMICESEFQALQSKPFSN